MLLITVNHRLAIVNEFESSHMLYSKLENLSMTDNTTVWLNDSEDIDNGLTKPLSFMSNNINSSTTNLAGANTQRRLNITNDGSIVVQQRITFRLVLKIN